MFHFIISWLKTKCKITNWLILSLISIKKGNYDLLLSFFQIWMSHCHKLLKVKKYQKIFFLLLEIKPLRLEFLNSRCLFTKFASLIHFGGIQNKMAIFILFKNMATLYTNIFWYVQPLRRFFLQKDTQTETQTAPLK